MSISIHALLAESDTLGGLWVLSTLIFLSTLSLRRATHFDNYNLHCVEISIHALLAESDYDTYAKVLRVNISIHALLAESDAAIGKWDKNDSCNFYPRSPCGERL